MNQIERQCVECDVWTGPGYAIQAALSRGNGMCVCSACVESDQRALLRMGMEARGLDSIEVRSGALQQHFGLVRWEGVFTWLKLFRKEKLLDDIRRIHCKQLMKCALTFKDVTNLSEELVSALTEQKRGRDELAAVKAQFKIRDTELANQVNSLREKLATGYETRIVAIEKRLNFTIGNVIVVMMDTGEIIATRPIQDDERQLPIEVTTESATEVLREAIDTSAEEAFHKRKRGKKTPAPTPAPVAPHEIDEEDTIEFTEETGEETTESKAEDKAEQGTPELVDGSRTTEDDIPVVVDVPEQGAGTPPPDAPKTVKDEFDRDAKDFLEKATPLQRSVILDPVKTREEMITDGGEVVTPTWPGPLEAGAPTQSPKPRTRRKI